MGSRAWKRVHWLVYPLLAATLLHQSLIRSKTSVILSYFGAFVLMVGYVVLKYCAWSGRLPLFGGLQNVIVARYRDYRRGRTEK